MCQDVEIYANDFDLYHLLFSTNMLPFIGLKVQLMYCNAIDRFNSMNSQKPHDSSYCVAHMADTFMTAKHKGKVKQYSKSIIQHFDENAS